MQNVIAIERYETKKTNTSNLDEIVGKRYRYDNFSWIWHHTNDFVQIFATSGNTSSHELQSINSSKQKFEMISLSSCHMIRSRDQVPCLLCCSCTR